MGYRLTDASEGLAFFDLDAVDDFCELEVFQAEAEHQLRPNVETVEKD